MDPVTLMQGIRLASELIAAGSELMAKLNERQTARLEQGAELTKEDLRELLEQGDVAQRIERAKLLELQARQQAS